MVTDLIPETETPTSLPEGTPPGDAGGTPGADAATAEVEAFLDSRDGKEGADAATEPTKGETKPDPVDAELQAAREAAAQDAAEKAESETRARIAAEQEQAQETARRTAEQRAFQQNYQNRMREAAQEAYDAAIELGLSEADARERGTKAAQRFNSHHADGLKLYQAEAQSRAASEVIQGFNAGLASVLDDAERVAFFGAPDQPKVYGTQKEVLGALKDLWQKDRMTPSEVKAHTTKAILDYRRELEAKGLIAGSASGSQAEAGGPTGRQFGSEYELNVAFNTNQIDRTAYAREYKRLTGREP